MKKLFVITLIMVLLTGCSRQTAGQVPSGNTGGNHSQTQGEKVSTRIDVSALITDRDKDPGYKESESAIITLNGASASCSSNAVEIRGSTVTIIDEGTYILRGSLTDGQIIVNAAKEDKTQIVLDGVDIQSGTGAPIYILQADKVFITLPEGKENSLANGGSFQTTDDDNVDGVIFSKEDVTLNGKGSLTVTSPAGHGIVSKDELTVTGGSYTLSCASHGLAGKDSVAITDATFHITAGKDGIHGENNDDTALGYVYIAGGDYTITAEGDGISASNSMQIDGGTFSIVTGGGSENAQQSTSNNWGGMGGGFGGGMGGKPGKRETVETAATAEDRTSIKGIKAACDLVINGGSFTMDCADDGIHSNANLTVTGGSFTIATGDDGFHADETLTVTGSTVNITESYEGLEGLHIIMSGGDITLVASDDGLNAAGGTDESGFGGIRGDQFGGGMGRPGMGGGFGGGMSSGNGSIVISGGKLDITASGDGIDANGTLEITGGNTVVCGPTRGDTATLDYDRSAVISGGTFIGTGASGMAQTFSDTTQGIIAVQVGNQAAGTQITVTDSQGKVILSHSPALDFAVAILSSPALVTGQSYTLTIGTISETITAN